MTDPTVGSSRGTGVLNPDLSRYPRLLTYQDADDEVDFESVDGYAKYFTLVLAECNGDYSRAVAAMQAIRDAGEQQRNAEPGDPGQPDEQPAGVVGSSWWRPSDDWESYERAALREVQARIVHAGAWVLVGLGRGLPAATMDIISSLLHLGKALEDLNARIALHDESVDRTNELNRFRIELRDKATATTAQVAAEQRRLERALAAARDAVRNSEGPGD